MGRRETECGSRLNSKARQDPDGAGVEIENERQPTLGIESDQPGEPCQSVFDIDPVVTGRNLRFGLGCRGAKNLLATGGGADKPVQPPRNGQCDEAAVLTQARCRFDRLQTRFGDELSLLVGAVRRAGSNR